MPDLNIKGDKGDIGSPKPLVKKIESTIVIDNGHAYVYQDDKKYLLVGVTVLELE